jgi:hypothetical protein
MDMLMEPALLHPVHHVESRSQMPQQEISTSVSSSLKQVLDARSVLSLLVVEVATPTISASKAVVAAAGSAKATSALVSPVPVGTVKLLRDSARRSLLYKLE